MGTPERTEGPCYAVRRTTRKTTQVTDRTSGIATERLLVIVSPVTGNRCRPTSRQGVLIMSVLTSQPTSRPTSRSTSPSTSRQVRRAAAAAAGLALTAGGLVAALPATASGTPACTNADLTASYRHSDDGAGHRYGFIVLRNTSGHACHTGGYGGISYVGDGDGTQIGAPAVRTDTAAVATYVLTPGQRLRSPLDEVRAGTYSKKRCRPAHVDGFRVYVPNATKAQYVARARTGCRNHHVKLIFQKPLRRP